MIIDSQKPREFYKKRCPEIRFLKDINLMKK